MLSNSIANDSIRAVHSVSELCAKTRAVLDEKFNHIWVAGEIASISTPASGHWYLSLKDDKAQLRCVIFKAANSRCQKPKIGDEVLASGRFSLYEARGDLQLILNHIEPRGAGVLHKQFEELKNKLADEGIFSSEHKKPLPKYPKHIALITSSTGAALDDVLAVFRRQKYGGQVSLFSSQVQGENAPRQLISALQAANATSEVDLILLSRGGGSYEDLFCFNDENLARAIFASSKPVVSAVGHEIDTTIGDFVADMRSATPTAAAEQILTSYIGLPAELDRLLNKLNRAHVENLTGKQSNLIALQHRLQSPLHNLQNFQQQLDRLQEQQGSHLSRKVEQNRHRLELLTQRLKNRSASHLIESVRKRIDESSLKLLRLEPEILVNRQQLLIQTARHLEAVSPMATLTRGYSVLLGEERGVIKSIGNVQKGYKLQALVADGTIDLEVVGTKASVKGN